MDLDAACSRRGDSITPVSWFLSLLLLLVGLEGGSCGDFVRVLVVFIDLCL